MSGMIARAFALSSAAVGAAVRTGHRAAAARSFVRRLVGPKMLAAIGVASVFAMPATAATIGDTISCSGSFLRCSQASAVVGSGVEFGIGSLLAADFSGGVLRLSNITDREVRIASCCSQSFIDRTNPFTAVTSVQSTGVTFDNWFGARVVNGELDIALDGLTFARGGALTIGLAQAPAAPAVPEPATWAMLLLGFGGTGAGVRRSRRPANAVIAHS